MLSARGLDTLLADLEKQQALMAEVVDEDARDKAVRRYGHLEERFARSAVTPPRARPGGSVPVSACPNGS